MIKIILAIMTLAMVGCTTIHNDQRACVTDCDIGGTGYAGVGADIHNDQQICEQDCNIGSGGRVYSVPSATYFSANTVYYPYHLRYNRGPMLMYHY